MPNDTGTPSPTPETTLGATPDATPDATPGTAPPAIPVAPRPSVIDAETAANMKAEREARLAQLAESAKLRRNWGRASFLLFLAFSALFAFAAYTMYKMYVLTSSQLNADLAFIFASNALTSTSLLRLIAAMAGSALAFAGLMISFFTHDKQTSLTAAVGGAQGTSQAQSSPDTNVSLSTYSPGIVAIVVGAIVVLGALFARATHDYTGASKIIPIASVVAAQDEKKDISPSGVPAPDATAQGLKKNTSGGSEAQSNKNDASPSGVPAPAQPDPANPPSSEAPK